MINDKIANTKIVDEIEERKEEEDQTENPSKIQYQKKENKEPIKLADPKTIKTVEVKDNCCWSVLYFLGFLRKGYIERWSLARVFKNQ